MTKYIFLLLVMLGASCKKFVDVGQPSTSMTGETVFHSEATATAAVTSIYGRMMSSQSGFASGNNLSAGFLGALAADELRLVNTDEDLQQFYQNALQAGNFYLTFYTWNEIYQYIYSANLILENIRKHPQLSVTLQDQLEGEARFIRAFCYLYLVNFFGDVPLATSSNYQVNAQLPRSAVQDVYQLITADLASAVTLLAETYVDQHNQPTTERTRPNRTAAQALLSRVYLYTGEWSKASELADVIVAKTSYTLPALSEVFLKNATEAIWQLQPVTSGLNTWEAFYYIQPGTPWNAVLSDQLLQSFEPADQRKIAWIHYDTSGAGPYTYPYKYRVQFQDEKTEYSMVIRLAEVYLIRAEARLQQGDMEGARSDINVIRQRAGLSPVTANTADALLNAVMQERRTELFSEWGHRWIDLKRTGKANEVLSAIKAGWQSTDQCFPIPENEMENNLQLVQNPGY